MTQANEPTSINNHQNHASHDDLRATDGFVFNHTMLRIKDPAVSLPFYEKLLGMRCVNRLDFPEMAFTLYFLAHHQNGTFADDDAERREQVFSRAGILELTHNWGTETQADFHYHNGNEAPQGFGHICFSVPDFEQAIAWFDKNNVPYVKRPEDGKMNHIAFIKDPDGYWIEIVSPARMR